MEGGRQGLLTNTESLCGLPAKAKRSRVIFRGQNGAVQKQRPILRAKCGKGRKAKRRARSSRHGRVG